MKMYKIEYKKPVVTAELGCNHKGDFNIALELVEIAKQCGADVVKFQKRHNKTLLTEDQYNSTHPNPMHSYGDTYGEHREFLEFNLDQHAELKKWCERIGIIYSTSVWEEVSAEEIISLNPEFIKVPSACNNNFKMLEVLRDEYDGEVHISTGMTLSDEIEEIVNFFEKKNKAKNSLIIYNCTSGYPVPFEDICLLNIRALREKYGNRIKDFGFSGHHLGIAIDNAAFTLGATWIERHFTKDRTWKGTDHAASLEPTGLRKLVRDLNATYTALRFKDKDILDIEQIQKDKLKYRKKN